MNDISRFSPTVRLLAEYGSLSSCERVAVNSHSALDILAEPVSRRSDVLPFKRPAKTRLGFRNKTAHDWTVVEAQQAAQCLEDAEGCCETLADKFLVSGDDDALSVATDATQSLERLNNLMKETQL